MKVEVLKLSKRIKGNVGDVVEIPAEIGNPLSCRGIVRVVSHDQVKPGQGCIVAPLPETYEEDYDDDDEDDKE